MLSLDQNLKLPNMTLEAHQSFPMQKIAPKTANFEKTETISKFAKNGHYAKVIASGKCCVWIKTSNSTLEVH